MVLPQHKILASYGFTQWFPNHPLLRKHPRASLPLIDPGGLSQPCHTQTLNQTNSFHRKRMHYNKNINGKQLHIGCLVGRTFAVIARKMNLKTFFFAQGLDQLLLHLSPQQPLFCKLCTPFGRLRLDRAISAMHLSSHTIMRLIRWEAPVIEIFHHF